MIVYYVWESYDRTRDGNIVALYLNKQDALEGFKDALKYAWPNTMDSDDNGRTFDQCVLNMQYVCGDTYIILGCDYFTDSIFLKKIQKEHNIKIYYLLGIYGVDATNKPYVSLYVEEDSVREDFKKILSRIWPDNLNVDDNGRTFDECVEDMLYEWDDTHIIVDSENISDDIISEELKKHKEQTRR